VPPALPSPALPYPASPPCPPLPCPAPLGPSPPVPPPPASPRHPQSNNKNWKLRGVQWRVDLDVLPRKPAPVDELRRAAADGRRRYAELRRRLLVDPHLMENCQTQAQLNQDNPLSLDPESVWGQYFRNTELERTIDKDLMRLYPENGSFFQSPGCQAILRRILLVWSLIHPESSYRQGMHELLAPLAYVLHVDVNHLQHIKYQCEDRFDDPFDRFSAPWTTIMERSANVSIPRAAGGKETLSSNSNTEGTARLGSTGACCEPSGDDEDMQALILGSDNYGAEGELGALLSSRFLEHDAYCMFDALLSGQKGAVVMANYFLTSSGPSSFGGNPPVLEASDAIYRALAAVDKPLYMHLVELGIEPQYFTLRWVRLLFGREFLLENLLLLWDAIFSASNTPISSGVEQENFSSNIQYSARSAFISSLAVAMLLYVRPVLLASPDAAGCLKRLLNYPQISDITNLIETAKFLQPLVQAAARTPAPSVPRTVRTPEKKRTLKHSISGSISPPIGQSVLLAFQEQSIPCSPDFLRMSLPDGYWEEKWTHSILQKFISGEVMDAQGIDSAGKGYTAQMTVKYSAGKEETGNATQSTLQVNDQHVNAVDLALKGSGVCNWMEPAGNDEDQLLLQECFMSKHNFNLQKQDSDMQPEYSHPQSSAESTKIAVELEVTRTIHAHGSYVEQSIVQAERSLKDYKSAHHPMPRSPSIASIEGVEEISQTTNDLSFSDKPKPSPPSSKLNWVWNFRKNTTGEKTVENVARDVPKSGNDRNFDSSDLEEDLAAEQMVSSPGKSTRMHNDTLQALGQSMLDHIQVVESSLSWTPDLEHEEQSSQASLHRKGCTAVLIALAELRKISITLQHM
ncbi:unnamed protein product, partial [Sphagnum troendelagicum]